VPVVGGLFLRRARAAEALAAIAAGVGTLLVATYTGEGRGYGLLNPEMLGLLASATAYMATMMARRSMS
jgi:hypothetical protein